MNGHRFTDSNVTLPTPIQPVSAPPRARHARAMALRDALKHCPLSEAAPLLAQALVAEFGATVAAAMAMQICDETGARQ